MSDLSNPDIKADKAPICLCISCFILLSLVNKHQESWAPWDNMGTDGDKMETDPQTIAWIAAEMPSDQPESCLVRDAS